MKNIKEYKNMMRVFLLIFTLTLGSCKKYLDVQRNSQLTYLKTAEDCQLLLNNYSLFNTGYPSDALLSSDDYFVSNTSYTASNVTQDERDLYAWASNAIRITSDLNTQWPQWVGPYNKVYHANWILETVAGIKTGDTPQATLNDIRGQALFFRAYNFWTLAQMYANAYSNTASTDPGIELRLSSDINDNVGRATVKETYDRIVQDLNEAVGLLNTSSTVSSRPSKVAAYAMLARVYLSMEDYTGALNAANSALALKNTLLDYNTISTTSLTPFARFNAEVVFQSVILPRPLLSPNNNGAPSVRINEELYASYNDNDLRKLIFFKPNMMTFINNNQDNYISVSDGTYGFSGNYEEQSSAVQFNGLAVDELYLTRAECYARASNITAAMTDLNALLIKRWKNTVTYVPVSAGTAAEALNKVLMERRKELVMRSQRWTDARRLKLSFTREVISLVATGNSSSDYTLTRSVVSTFALPAGDKRFTLLIPQDVITNDGIPQNLR